MIPISRLSLMELSRIRRPSTSPRIPIPSRLAVTDTPTIWQLVDPSSLIPSSVLSARWQYSTLTMSDPLTMRPSRFREKVEPESRISEHS